MVKREIVIFFLLFLLGLFLVYTYSEVTKSKERIFERIEQHEISKIAYVLQNMQQQILKHIHEYDYQDLITFFKEKEHAIAYEEMLAMMLTSDVKYSYILYRDEERKFRFLLDASKTDKASFNQKFDVNAHEYDLVYTTKKSQIIRQQNIENLYVTYLHPIIKNGEVVALFNIDFTTDIKSIILESIKPLETLFTLLTLFVVIFMAMTLMQIFHYFITKKKIFTDPLTKTFNRNYLEEISSVLNLGNYSLAMLDLDKFKIINDTYGHKAGDYVLSHASQIIKNSIRDNDIFVRYGGEEFLLFINNRDSKRDICERVRDKIAKEKFVYNGHEIYVTLSIGLHTNPYLEKNMQEAIKKADTMLYEAKKNGRNRVVVYDEKRETTASSSFSSKDLAFVKEALDEDRVTCYYQPIYNHKTGEVFKYEALVRIIAQDGTIITPYQFLPQIKSTNMHYKLTQRILALVFEKFRTNQKLVSINLSFTDLNNPDIEETIIQALRVDQDLASRITFEILESDEVDDIESFKQKIHMLHSLKAKVSIDDFGSGYSNFKRIIDTEANYLKIDGSLVKNIHKNSKDFKVVKSIVHFATQSNMQTIAEFVHSKEVYEKLLSLDIDYMQGYYIAAPTPELLKKEELFQ
ncbi:MAG: bifunctional diguanylate cyclase/phosphodiesterase [Sulfurimonas sp.]|uniref:putative bifunctional diguanylate cyclase/phosphodiesterase n=1 Tax=Sulfurimonas sp. TaxID=2022749 RepID=UPI0026149BC0|nr:bifunctional diguanylate cyclase/phosphodiesterase [Sulfurimonas sp.]MDD2653437.1 bifunctional diguanylate cyclase/phosphodiesterase [Sulfurimonas sp.]MDD3452644.1 bifunctional diguanylate cyclase/phosphodiesterase [Sulfurimonas sp.]